MPIEPCLFCDGLPVYENGYDNVRMGLSKRFGLCQNHNKVKYIKRGLIWAGIELSRLERGIERIKSEVRT